MKYLIYKINNQSFKDKLYIISGCLFVYLPLINLVSKK
jgi:hypothetical protein